MSIRSVQSELSSHLQDIAAVASDLLAHFADETHGVTGDNITDARLLVDILAKAITEIESVTEQLEHDTEPAFNERPIYGVMSRGRVVA